MDIESLPRVRFRRGPDRRSVERAPGGRQRGKDQRQLRIGWIPLFRGADEATVSEMLGDCEVLLLPAATTTIAPLAFAYRTASA